VNGQVGVSLGLLACAFAPKVFQGLLWAMSHIFVFMSPSRFDGRGSGTGWYFTVGSTKLPDSRLPSRYTGQLRVECGSLLGPEDLIIGAGSPPMNH